MGYIEIINALEIYFKAVESNQLGIYLNDSSKLQNLFECCCFIECAIIHAKSSQITLCEEIILKWLKKHRKPYDCELLKTICDELLRICLKNSEISADSIKELISIYVQKLGSKRLVDCLKSILADSYSANAVHEALKKMSVPFGDLDKHLLLHLWERNAQMGRSSELSNIIYKMVAEGELIKLVQMAADSDFENARRLIVRCLTQLLNQQESQFFCQLSNVDSKLISNITDWDNGFRNALIDTTAFFCDRMRYEKAKWISQTEVEYANLMRVFKALFEGSERTRQIIEETIQVRKTLNQQCETNIWQQIEIDCIW